MPQEFSMKTIARIHSDFAGKFGVPRQSGLVEALEARVVFEPEYRNPAALRGLEGFSHIWLVWVFDQAVRAEWSPTVRPPRLGGNARLGVFATRSPFRPNPLGLSCVRLVEVRQDRALGPVLTVAGADLLDGTPIYDIKPYLPYADCRPEAAEGYTGKTKVHELLVDFPKELLERYPMEKRAAVVGILAQDPRPAYVRDPERVYGVAFGEFDIKFQVNGDRLTVRDVVRRF